jgi:hypothetical protein
MTGQEALAAAITRRTAAGLKLTFMVPVPNSTARREFVCFAKDETEKALWLASADRDGWERV